MTDELRPVLGPRTPRKLQPVKGQRLTRSVCFIMCGAGISALIMSTYYFIGFAENDQNILHLLSAFALCFGIGALFYLPTFFIARKAHLFLKTGPRPQQARQIFAVILPWPILAFFFAQIGGYWRVIAAIIFGLALLCAYWAFTLVRSKK